MIISLTFLKGDYITMGKWGPHSHQCDEVFDNYSYLCRIFLDEKDVNNEWEGYIAEHLKEFATYIYSKSKGSVEKNFDVIPGICLLILEHNDDMMTTGLDNVMMCRMGRIFNFKNQTIPSELPDWFPNDLRDLNRECIELCMKESSEFHESLKTELALFS